LLWEGKGMWKISPRKKEDINPLDTEKRKRTINREKEKGFPYREKKKFVFRLTIKGRKVLDRG